MDKLQKLSELFDGKEKAFLCLKKLQEHGVIAGSSVVYALSDALKKEDIGDVDVFLLKGMTFTNILEIVSEYFSIESYLIVDNDYEISYDKKDNEVSVITLKINDKINIQVIITDFITPQEILTNFDLDYISVAICKGKIYGEEKDQESWKEKRVLSAHTKDIFRHRFIKTLKKGFAMPFWKTKSHEIKYKEIFDISCLKFIPLLHKTDTTCLNISSLKIIDVVKINNEGLIVKDNNSLHKANFVLSDGITSFHTDELVANIQPNFVPSRYLYGKRTEMKTGHIKPYISYCNGKGVVKYLIVKYVDIEEDKEMTNVIPFDVPNLNDKNYNLEREDLLTYADDKRKSSFSKIARSAWEEFYNCLKDGKTIEIAYNHAIGTYQYDIAKSKGRGYFPFDLDGKMIASFHVTDLGALNSYLC